MLASHPEARAPSCLLAGSAYLVVNEEEGSENYGHPGENQSVQIASRRCWRRCLTACGPWPGVLVEELG